MPGTGRWKPEDIFIAEKTHWGLKLQDVLDSEESDHVDWFRRDDAGPSLATRYKPVTGTFGGLASSATSSTSEAMSS